MQCSNRIAFHSNIALTGGNYDIVSGINIVLHGDVSRTGGCLDIVACDHSAVHGNITVTCRRIGDNIMASI